MEEIVLFGAGAGLVTALEYIKRVGGFKVKEIWDNSASKQGNIIQIDSDSISVNKPHLIEGIPIIITAIEFHDQISLGLIELGITPSLIKKRNYIFHAIQDTIIKKYENVDDLELKNTVSWIKNNGLDIYNGEWLQQEIDLPEIFYDEQNSLYYANWNGKPLYLKREYNSVAKAKDYIRNIVIEQLPQSPHFYNPDFVSVIESDIVLDCGAAEGFFALDLVDVAKRIIIVEMDAEWIEALEATFEPYHDKVIIIRKAIGSSLSENETTLDELLNEYSVTYIKMDVEGCETEALSVASRQSLENVRCIKACTYHKEGDEIVINHILDDNGFETTFSQGYMFFAYEAEVKPSLRKGLIFGKRMR